MNPVFETKLNEYPSGYRKNKSTQHTLLQLIESLKRWKIEKYHDNHGFSVAVLMDPSKAFDTINHDVLLAKLHAYVVSTCAIKLMTSYLRKSFQHTYNDAFSGWEELLTRVPQGPELCPLRFNVYLNLFYAVEKSEICKFADDNTPYASWYGLEDVMINI